MLLAGDEISMAKPPLLAAIHRRAFYGRARHLGLKPNEIMEHPFGDVLLQAFMGDFLQLNPVKSHTLLEAFSKTRVPGVPSATTDEDRDGYHLFRNACKPVILFTDTHRFLDEDHKQLLEIMATPGGRAVPKENPGTRAS